jgi:hypothetical protein
MGAVAVLKSPVPEGRGFLLLHVFARGTLFRYVCSPTGLPAAGPRARGPLFEITIFILKSCLLSVKTESNLNCKMLTQKDNAPC